MNVLVTGGAGYVGSAVVERLLEEGYGVVVVDNLQQGHSDSVPERAIFVFGDVRDLPILNHVFERYRIGAVMHMAAETIVEYSMTDPGRHFETNLGGGLALLRMMLSHGVDRIIFSSTAAVYGEPQCVPIDENHPTCPINAYGESKLMFEKILEWYGRAHGLNHVSLRYFNAAGATEKAVERHDPETHLIPNVLRACSDGKPLQVYGVDYPTRDGSCLRDYVHVADIACAHVLALEKIESLDRVAYNLGTSQGATVFEVVETVGRVVGKEVTYTVSDRRGGDPASLVASNDLARADLGWDPYQSQLETIIKSVWERAHGR